MLRFLTAGESHGEKEIAILEGFPAGIKISIDFINNELKRRQEGYGRGPRMKIEKDKVKIISGIKKGETIGSPIAIMIDNRDFSIEKLPEVKNVRPGHADLPGVLKYGFNDARCVLERASARETVTRVAVGAICKLLLLEFNINVFSHTIGLGNIKVQNNKISIADIKKLTKNSDLRCIDKDVEKKMHKLIDKTKKDKDTLGGIIEVISEGIPPGLGSYVQYDKRLDTKLSGALMSIPSVKAVEIGDGIKNALKLGSKVHDEIYKGVKRKTNRAGGLEGGVTNGENLIIRAYVKPISTLMKPLDTINIDTGEETEAVKERSDVCVVPSAGVIGESMCAIVIAESFLEKFGGDCLQDIKESYEHYITRIKRFFN